MKLLLDLNLNSFTYSVFNTKRNSFEKIKTIQFEKNTDYLKKEIEKTEDLKKNYDQILGTIYCSKSTFIPTTLFDKKYIHHYLNSDNKLNNPTYIQQKFTDCYCVYSPHQSLEKILTQSFKNIQIKSFNSVFVDYSIHMSQHGEKEIFVYINNNIFHITYVKKKKFIFYNEFEFNNHTEFLYFFMNCLNTLDLDPVNVKINIMSDLEKSNTIFQKLKKYINNLYFLKKPNQFLYENEKIEYMGYKHHSIFGQLICE